MFDFTAPVELPSVDLIDICPGPPVQDVTLTLIDQELRLRTYFVPGGWTGDVVADGPPGFGTLDLTTLEPQPGFQTTATATEDPGFDPSTVIRLEAFFLSSGGMDNLELCPQPAGPRPVRKRVRFPVPVGHIGRR